VLGWNVTYLIDILTSSHLHAALPDLQPGQRQRRAVRPGKAGAAWEMRDEGCGGSAERAMGAAGEVVSRTPRESVDEAFGLYCTERSQISRKEVEVLVRPRRSSTECTTPRPDM
jgi:hypothetical protein